MIKSIETKYNEIKFRSRLEARWALFFDELKIEYQYEAEGFDIDGTWYLPDFYLPDYSCWIEVKPDGYKWREDKIIEIFSQQTNKKFLLIVGAPQQNKYKVYVLAVPEWDEEFKDNYLGDYGQFALARRASENELCFLGDIENGGIAFNLIDNSTDDGEREPVTFDLESVYKKAINKKFY